MKQVINAFVLSTAVLVTGSALADCPVYLEAEQLMECIVTEGADGEFKIPAAVAQRVALEQAKNKTAAIKPASESSDGE